MNNNVGVCIFVSSKLHLFASKKILYIDRYIFRECCGKLNNSIRYMIFWPKRTRMANDSSLWHGNNESER